MESVPEYSFVMHRESGDVSWGRVTAIRLHGRMFNPERVAPGEDPVVPEFWLERVTVTLTANTDFAERPEYYASEDNPSGVNAERWRVSSAVYDAAVLFETASGIDFATETQQEFFVIEDLEAQAPSQRFWLLRWVESCDLADATEDERSCWGEVKALYADF